MTLAHALLAWRRELSAEQEESLKTHMRRLLETSKCERTARVPKLWDDIAALTPLTLATRAVGGRPIGVRCTKDFERLPYGGDIFRRRYTASMLLDMNQHYLPKAFVHAVLLISKWLGAETYPRGIFSWPPAFPPESRLPGLR